MNVLVAIVNWNTRDILRDCLRSLPRGMGALDYKVCVVDNASSDGSADMVRREFPQVILLENKTNLGFSKACNQAARQAEADAYLFLNSDARLTDGAAERLYDFLKNNEHVAMAGPRLLHPDGRIQPSTYVLPGLFTEILKLFRLYKFLPDAAIGPLLLGSFWDHASTRLVGRLTGACILVKTAAIRDVGLMDETFPFYGEVHDWSWRFAERGWETWFYAGAEAVHVGGESAARRWGGWERRRLVLEAHHRLLKKHTTFGFRFFWYLIQFLSAEISLLCDAARGAGPNGALVWERKWFLERMGLGWARYAWNVLRRRIAFLQWLTLVRRADDLSAAAPELGAYWRESLSVEEGIRRRWLKDQGEKHKRGMLELSAARLLYIWTRAARPDVVLETGVANGASSVFILTALAKNGKGRLVSIDLPVTSDNQTFLPPGKSPGWLVDDSLRSRWNLLLGDSRRLLPEALEREGPVDIFIHDSDHSYEAMRWEYETAWPRVKPGGWLISDDVDFNNAFPEWAAASGGPSFIWAGRLGFLKK